MNRFLPLLLCCLIGCGTAGRSRERAIDSFDGDRLVIAFYNIENLFDPHDAPSSGDDDFTPDGSMRWTEQRLEAKLDALTRAIRAIDQLRGPDLLGVCEVENHRVLDRLVGEFLPLGTYSVVHAESPDDRGIDVAIVYRPATVKHVGLKMHRVDLGEGARPTRDIMEATFERKGRRFTVLVNHWPSRRGGERESEPRRIAAATVAARVIDSLRAIDRAHDIVLMGDLNDEPSNRSVRSTLGAVGYDQWTDAERMINLATPLEGNDTIGSYYYRGDWEMIDQIALSPGVLDSAGIVMLEPFQHVHAPDFLRDNKKNRPPRHTYLGTHYVGGTSDHFAVYAVVGWR